MNAISTRHKVVTADFGEALFNPDAATPEGLVGPDGQTAPKRFNVYRNNVIVSLTEALGRTFPAMKTLLGDEYFGALARVFIVAHPPQSPVLMWYGSDFAGFVEGFPPLADYPYLADVARVEWAWLQAYHAADVEPLDPAMLSAVAPEELGSVVFTKHPSAEIVASNWPILDLVQVNRFDEDGKTTIDLGVAQSVLITRPGLDVEILGLGPAGDIFFNALLQMATLGEAAAAAQDHSAEFSLSDSLSDGLSSGAFTSLQTA